MNLAAIHLTPKKRRPRLTVLLELFVVDGNPTQKSRHRSGELCFLGHQLTLGQIKLVHVSRPYVNDEQPGAKAVPSRYLLSRRQDESSRRLRRTDTSVSTQAAPALMIASGAEQTFGYCF